jgi:hypothetical protein
MRQISRASIVPLVGLALALPAFGCLEVDDLDEDVVDDPEGVGDSDGLTGELAAEDDGAAGDEEVAPGDDDHVAAAYCPTGNTTDVVKTVVWPDYPVFGGVSATAPDTSYWNDSDGTFTMRAGGIHNMPYHTTARASYKKASDFNGSTQAACEDLTLGYEVWAHRASTGCYEFRGAGTRQGVWTVAPYSGTHCSLGSPAIEIDTSVYSYVKVSSWAYTNTPIPSLPSVHFQQVLRPTVSIHADFE